MTKVDRGAILASSNDGDGSSELPERDETCLHQR